MRDAASRLAAGDASARTEVVINARGYAALLRQHIQKENGILFPLADQVIPVAQQAQVADDFERVEHEETGEGVHEKYLALGRGVGAGSEVVMRDSCCVNGIYLDVRLRRRRRSARSITADFCLVSSSDAASVCWIRR